MGKRSISVLLSIFVIVSFYSFSLSQDTTATGDKKTSTDTTKTGESTNMNESKEDKESKDTKGITRDDVSKEESAQSAKQTAKVYFDGYVTYVNALVMFKLSSKDNAGLDDKIMYKIDKSEFAAYIGPFAVKEEGTHLITYYSIDKMGNKEVTNKILNFVTDNTSPSVVVTTNTPVIKDKIYASDQLLFTVSAKDDLSGVGKIEYSTDGKSFITYEKPFSVVTENPVDFKIRAIDNVDNASEKFVFKAYDESGQLKEFPVASLKIYIDKKPPVVTVTPDKNFEVKDGKNIASTAFKYAINATDEDSGVAAVMVRVDGIGEFQPYKKEIEFAENGEHKIEAIAKDKVGNTSQPVILNIFVDNTPPVSEIKLITEK